MAVTREDALKKMIKGVPMDLEAFQNTFRAFNNPSAQQGHNNMIADTEFRIWNGGAESKGTDGRTTIPNDSAFITINYYRDSKYFADPSIQGGGSLEDQHFGVAGIAVLPKDEKVVIEDENGNVRDTHYTSVSKEQNNVCVAVEEYRDETLAPDMPGASKARVYIDADNLADSQHNARKEAGRTDPARLEKQKGRLMGIKIPRTQANNGIASISRDSMNRIVGQSAVQAYIFGSGKSQEQADAKKPNTQTIENVGNEFYSRLTGFMSDVAAQNKRFAEPFKASNGEVVENTAISSNFSLKPVVLEADGDGKKANPTVTAYAIYKADGSLASPSDTKEVNTWLRSVGERFNKENSKALNEKFAGNKEAAALVNNLKFDPYAVQPKDANGNNLGTGMIVQPRFTDTESPYAGVLRNANKVANHEITPQQGFGEFIVKNAAEVSAKYAAPKLVPEMRAEYSNTLVAAMEGAEAQAQMGE